MWTPLLAYALGWLLLRDHPELWLGLIILLVTPCTDWYLVFTSQARWNVRLSTALLPWHLVLQLLLLPVYLLGVRGGRGAHGLQGGPPGCPRGAPGAAHPGLAVSPRGPSLCMATLARNSPVALAIAVVAFPDRPLVALALVVGPLIELPVLAVVSQALLAARPVIEGRSRRRS